MATVVAVAIALSVAYSVLFCALFVISRAICSEDHRGTLDGSAPGIACRSARRMVGVHRVRWTPQQPVKTLAMRR
jgi:hypothetical protein